MNGLSRDLWLTHGRTVAELMRASRYTGLTSCSSGISGLERCLGLAAIDLDFLPSIVRTRNSATTISRCARSSTASSTFPEAQAVWGTNVPGLARAWLQDFRGGLAARPEVPPFRLAKAPVAAGTLA
jgi:hypothetical protein